MTEPVAVTKMAVGPAVFEPPLLAPWQASIGGLIIGDGTPYEIAALSGIEEMPGLRTSDEARPWSHGMWDGDDWADGRIIEATVEIAAEDGVTYDDALAAWRAVMVPTRTDDLVPFWVYLPHRGGLQRWQAKIRRHRIPTDQQYELGLATAELMLFASDPVGYGPQRQAEAGFPIPAGGLRFPLFTNGGTPTLQTNGAPDPRMTATTLSTNGATVTDTRPAVGAPDGRSFFRRTVQAANTSSPMSMALSGTGTAGIPCTSGIDYVGSWYARKSAGGPAIRLDYTWYDAVGTVIGTTSAGPTTSPGASWGRLFRTMLSPVGAAFVRPVLAWSGTALVNQTLDLAMFQWEPGTTPTAYKDGDDIGARWLGTPNASASSMFASVGAAATGFLDFGLPGKSAMILMDNPGTAETWPVYVIDGPVIDGFEIVDIPTGRRLRWVGDIPEGLSLTIDTRTGSVLLDGVADRSGQLVIREWAPVPPGGTSVGFFALETYTTARLTSTWAPGWW